MQHFDAQAIHEMEKQFRINLINSTSGFKPANLIGTKSADGYENLAIFSSVVHLGSDPALLGFIQRPVGADSHTYKNILATGIYTINHVPNSYYAQAHYTSARFDRTVSEFDACKLSPQYLDGFDAPFVAESVIRIGLRFIQEMPIEINGTRLIIGKVEHILLSDGMLDSDGSILLDQAKSTLISGLDHYFSANPMGRLPYAKVDKLPKF